MRLFISVLFATTTLFGVTAMAAAAEPVPQDTLEQMVEIQGDYALVDGRTARIFIMDSRLYLEIGRHAKELERVGVDLWETRDHEVSMRFKPGRTTNQIVLNYLPDPPSAAIRLTARESRGRGSND